MSKMRHSNLPNTLFYSSVLHSCTELLRHLVKQAAEENIPINKLFKLLQTAEEDISSY